MSARPFLDMGYELLDDSSIAVQESTTCMLVDGTEYDSDSMSSPPIISCKEATKYLEQIIDWAECQPEVSSMQVIYLHELLCLNDC